MPDAPTAPFPLPRHLLWEYDLDTLDYERHYRIIIERIIERGGMEEWVGAVRYYGRDLICAVAQGSRRLTERNRHFALLFVRSPLIAA